MISFNAGAIIFKIVNAAADPSTALSITQSGFVVCSARKELTTN